MWSRFADSLSSRQQSVGMVATLFVAGALWLWHVQRRGLDARRGMWTAFAVEVLQVSAILLPAYIGGCAPCVMAAILSLLGGAEAWAAAGRAWPQRWMPKLGAVLCVLLGFCAYAWLACLPQGFFWVLAIYGTAEVHDVAAWLVGGAWGRMPLVPGLSPHKTWEGELAGTLAGLVFAGVLGGLVPGARAMQFVAWAPLVLLGGVLGDLGASWLKRLARQKDFGNWVPTQGGAIDLYDALLVLAPMAAACQWLLFRGP